MYFVTIEIDKDHQKLIEYRNIIDTSSFKYLDIICYTVVSKYVVDGMQLKQLGDVAICFIYGSLSYISNPDFITRGGHDGKLSFDIINKSKRKKTPTDNYLLILHPYNDSNHKFDTQNYLAISSVVLGKNCVKDQLFTNTYDLKKDKMMVASHQKMVHIDGFPDKEMNNNALNDISRVSEAIGNYSTEDRPSIFLSLRWYIDAMNTNINESNLKFLKFWIAIETLCMHYTTNIKPLVKLLSKAYGYRDASEFKKLYLIGQISDIRSKIVHQGMNESLPIDLIYIIQSIYVDTLYYKIFGMIEERLLKIKVRLGEKYSEVIKEPLN